jgi:bifunctional DNA-binding transcriptional regulator/antitoxin component of YhaV-PrlF toxin-antitoxin module
MKVKVAKRFQITSSQQVRDQMGISVGDTVDIRRHEEK